MIKSKSNLIVTIITAVVALVAVVALAYVLISGKHIKPEPIWAPDDAYYAELDSVSDKLLENNHKTLMIYKQYGLGTEAPAYDTPPVDGAYIVKDENEDFTTLADIETLINSTFVEAEATRILTNCNGTGQIYGEKENILVMYKDLFTPMEYNLRWNAPVITYKNPTEDSVLLSIELVKVAVNESSEVETGETETITVTMLKEDGEWRLSKLTY